MAFVLIKSRSDLPLFTVSGKTQFFELSTPFRVRDAFSFEPFIHQTRFRTIAAKVFGVVQKVPILEQNEIDKSIGIHCIT